MNKMKKTLLMVLVLLLTASCHTQKKTYAGKQSKEAAVADGTPFEDKMSLPVDEQGLDIAVKVDFDEAQNILTLSMKGNRGFLNLREDVGYKPLFSHRFLGKHIMRPEKLPYPALVLPGTRYYLSDKVYKTFARKRKHHTLRRVMGAVSPELVLLSSSAAEPGNNVMTDSLVLRYAVSPEATKGEITLRNLYIMDAMPRKRGKQAYSINVSADLNTTYMVQIRRNPCFGTEVLLDSLSRTVQNIKADYRNLRKACPTGFADSEEAEQIFMQHRMFLLSRYQERKDSSACSDVQSQYDVINAYRDSISAAPCKYVPPVVDEEGKLLTGISAQILLETARHLDNTVAQILNSRDAVEIHDLTIFGTKLLRDVNNDIRTRGVINDEQNAALKVFRNSEAYFRTMILKQ